MISDPIPLHEVRRVLVIKLRHHGDVLLTSPLFSVLQARCPEAEIDALVYQDTASMLTLHPAIHAVHGIDRNWKKLGLWGQAKAEWQLLRHLQGRNYDLVIHLTEHWRGAWLSRLLQPHWSVAPSIGSRGKRWKRAFSHRYSQPRNALRHVAEANLDALRRIGIYPAPEERRLQLVPGPEAETRVANLLDNLGVGRQPFIHVHPASRWFFKCWTVEGMAKVIARLQQGGWPVVLSAAPDPAELALVAGIQQALASLGLPAALSLEGQLSLKELAALAGRARLFLGVDSAPMHIAAAMGTPTVVLFGPSGDQQWGPWGVPARVIASRQHPCRPCGIDGCGGGKLSDCLVSLREDEVFGAIQDLLAATESPCP